MKSYLKIFATLIMASAFLTGCDINPELTDSYPQDVAWSNEANLRLTLNGCYGLIGGYYGAELADDAFSDILKMNAPHETQNLVVLGISPVTPAMNPWDTWAGRHNWQIALNRFLMELDKHKENFSEAAYLEAQAEFRFFRAFVDFDLAKRYGGSFVLHKTMPELGQKEFSLCEPDDAWNFIAEDLDFAAQYLPDKAAVPAGRLTKGAAYGLKARAMLYAQRWEESAAACEKVKELGYALYTNPSRPDKGYGELFTDRRTAPVVNNESIIEFGPIYNELDYAFDVFYCPPSDGGNAQISPTDDLVAEYEMADGSSFDWNDEEMKKHPYEGREPRFYATILYNGCTWKGRTLYTYAGSIDGYALGGGTTCTGYCMRKFCDEQLGINQIRNTDLTYISMRYAEILLIKAEAYAEMGKLSEALSALNEVRTRVGLPERTAESKSSFMKLLRHERMVELAFEGHRFWDIRRWGLGTSLLHDISVKGVKPMYDEESGETTYQRVSCDGNKKRIYLEKYNRFPIPASELLQNKAIQQFDEWK